MFNNTLRFIVSSSNKKSEPNQIINIARGHITQSSQQTKFASSPHLSANLLVSESAVATARADLSSDALPPDAAEDPPPAAPLPPPELGGTLFSTEMRTTEPDLRLRPPTGDTDRDLDLERGMMMKVMIVMTIR